MATNSNNSEGIGNLSLPHDPVNRPHHYTQGGVECIHAIEAALGPEGFIAFLRGQVIKYNWRLGKKDAPVQEAGKAKWYQDLLVQKLQEQAATAHAKNVADLEEQCAGKNLAEDDPAEVAFWRFDARYKGYAEWRMAPQSIRDAFKAEYRIAVQTAKAAKAIEKQTPIQGEALTENKGTENERQSAIQRIFSTGGLYYDRTNNRVYGPEATLRRFFPNRQIFGKQSGKFFIHFDPMESPAADCPPAADGLPG